LILDSRVVQAIIDQHLRDAEHQQHIRDYMIRFFRADWERIVRAGFHLDKEGSSPTAAPFPKKPSREKSSSFTAKRSSRKPFSSTVSGTSTREPFGGTERSTGRISPSRPTTPGS